MDFFSLWIPPLSCLSSSLPVSCPARLPDCLSPFLPISDCLSLRPVSLFLSPQLPVALDQIWNLFATAQWTFEAQNVVIFRRQLRYDRYVILATAKSSLSSQKYGFGIRDPERTFSGSRGQKGIGSRIRFRNTDWECSADNHSQHKQQIIHFTNVALASHWDHDVVCHLTEWSVAVLAIATRPSAVTLHSVAYVLIHSKTPHSWETVLLTLDTYFRLISPKLILPDWKN
jgi:hypothetical protein